jgi:hypothetical protein
VIASKTAVRVDDEVNMDQGTLKDMVAGFSRQLEIGKPPASEVCLPADPDIVSTYNQLLGHARTLDVKGIPAILGARENGERPSYTAVMANAGVLFAVLSPHETFEDALRRLETKAKSI